MSEKKLRRFRVIIPSHSEGVDENNKPIIYGKGDIVETYSDLNKMNSPNSKKFQELSPPEQPVEDVEEKEEEPSPKPVPKPKPKTPAKTPAKKRTTKKSTK